MVGESGFECWESRFWTGDARVDAHGNGVVHRCAQLDRAGRSRSRGRLLSSCISRNGSSTPDHHRSRHLVKRPRTTVRRRHTSLRCLPYARNPFPLLALVLAIPSSNLSATLAIRNILHPGPRGRTLVETALGGDLRARQTADVARDRGRAGHLRSAASAAARTFVLLRVTAHSSAYQPRHALAAKLASPGCGV